MISSRILSKSFQQQVKGTASIATCVFKRLYSNEATVEVKEGPIFKGKSFGANKPISGELVFTTSLVGYPESMTDPSYKGQILVFTQPLIGNYGVPGRDRDEFGLLKYFESDTIQVSGIVVNNYATKYSHWNAVESLGEWCTRHDVPAITDVDTRELTKVLRNKGSSLGRINIGNKSTVYDDCNKKNLVAEVSTKETQVYNKGGEVVIAVIDCGVKNNIIRCLAQRGAEVHVVPWDSDPSQLEYDGLFISNGPGDPITCSKTADNLKKQLDADIPIFGICMGNLILGLAAGAKSYKLKHGNRGHNQPALNLLTNKGVITSQNHGYAIDEQTLPAGWIPYFRNVNDGSNEGLIHQTKPFFSVQFHPEYMGGPQDSEFLFDNFMENVRAYKKQKDGNMRKSAAM